MGGRIQQKRDYEEYLPPTEPSLGESSVLLHAAALDIVVGDAQLRAGGNGFDPMPVEFLATVGCSLARIP